MKGPSVKWKVAINPIINIASLTYMVVNANHSEFTTRILLRVTAKTMDIAEKNGGRFIPLEEPPSKREEEFTYFEVKFINSADLISFLTSLSGMGLSE